MLEPPSANLQPYDRDTGAELSPQQQADCQLHYAVIKAYIDDVESQFEGVLPLHWSRMKHRCSTAELLDAVASLANDIRQVQHGHLHGSHGTEYAICSQEQVCYIDGVSVGATKAVGDPRFYKLAMDLLHELVERLADDGDTAPEQFSREMHELPVVQGSSLPSSIGNNSEASTGFSNRPKSLVTSTTPITGASSTTSELNQMTVTASKQPIQQQSESTAAVPSTVPIIGGLGLPIIENTLEHNAVKKQATNDWVLEYLRGGWLASSPPVFSMSGDPSPAGSFGPIQRIDSDETPSVDDDRSLRRDFSFGIRPPNRGRPIPTMASRFMGNSRDRKYSVPSVTERFKTPKSIISGNTVYCTPNSGSANIESIEKIKRTSTWNAYLRERGLIPNPFDEMDWSGRGQHAEFDAAEESEVPLTLEKALGHSATALVESVRCRRIRLARKTVQVNRRLKREEAIKEVEHLQRLKHPHIIRVVGTYTLPRKLSILLYPVCEYTLDQFLESTQEGLPASDRSARLYSISTFIRCLAKSLAYIHENAMKHMDIKPKNLLVRDMRSSTICNQGQYKIYVADFGIARAYQSVEDCNTESLTAFTRMYAAPEVVAQRPRDQKADIFSLGAVYAEMFAVLATEDQYIPNLDRLTKIREENPDDRSFQANAERIQAWLRRLSITTYGFESAADRSNITELAARMLSVDPAQRPTASTVVTNIPFLAFCCDVNGGPEPFEAAERPTNRELYDRQLDIAEEGLRYSRCVVEGCVKVYSSGEKLRYHELNGHGEALSAIDDIDDDLRVDARNEGYLADVGKMNASQRHDMALHRELTENLRWS